MNSDWLSHPTMEKYVTDNPECKTSQGLKCAKCGAKSIKNWGFMVQTTHADFLFAIIVEQNYTEARETSSNKAILRSTFSVTFYAALVM